MVSGSPDALRMFAAAKQIRQQLTQIDPDNVDWLEKLATAYRCTGRVFEAQAKLDEALSGVH
jgi:hypothetical protein